MTELADHAKLAHFLRHDVSPSFEEKARRVRKLLCEPEQSPRNHAAILPNSAIRKLAFQEPAEAAQAIIDLRNELDLIYAASKHSDAHLYNAVKHSIARVRKWDRRL